MEGNPVGILTELCTQLRLNLSFQFERLHSTEQTRCVLTVDSSQSEINEQPLRRFEATGPNKKDAKQSCSLEALKIMHLEKKERLNEVQTIQQTIRGALDKERLWRDPVFHAYVSFSEANGKIPIWILTISKFISKRLKQESNHQISVHDMMSFLVQELKKEPINDMELADDNKWISLPATVQSSDYVLKDIKETEEDPTAIFLQIDERMTPEIVQLRYKDGYLRSISETLGTNVKDLSIVQSAGPRTLPLIPLDLEDEQQRINIDSNEGEIFGPDVLAKKFASVESRPPCIWSDDLSVRINKRASWLAGQSIYGNALLTTCRPSRDASTGSIVMKWRDFSQMHFWTLVESKFPDRLHNFSVIERLPKYFTEASQWHGILPVFMLQQYSKGTCREVSISEVKEPNLTRIEIEAKGTTIKPIIITAATDIESRKEQACLDLLHQLQGQDLRFWETCEDQIPMECKPETTVTTPGEKFQLTVEEHHQIKIRYRLFLQSTTCDNWYLVDANDRFIIDLEQDPILQSIFDGKRINTTSKSVFFLRLQGCQVKCCLFAKILAILGEESDGIKLFRTPLSEQRMEIVHQALIDHHCQEVLDVGCGEGRFLDHLIRSSPHQFIHLAGVDISSKALARAQKSLSQHSLPTKLDISLFHGSLTDCEEFQFDAITMIEVIEHLDPKPLESVSSIILDKIQPRVFIVTTPNWEYNKLLYAAGGMPATDVLGRDGSPLRCSDHRFEWTRDEFQSWALQVASMYNYNVQFLGIGQLAMEQDVLQDMNREAEDFGRASQMAIFVQKQCSVRKQSILDQSINKVTRLWSWP